MIEAWRETVTQCVAEIGTHIFKNTCVFFFLNTKYRPTTDKAQAMYAQIESKRAVAAAQTDAFFRSAKARDYFTGVLEVRRVAARVAAALAARGSVPSGTCLAVVVVVVVVICITLNLFGFSCVESCFY
jgi:hypothetical protein